MILVEEVLPTTQISTKQLLWRKSFVSNSQIRNQFPRVDKKSYLSLKYSSYFQYLLSETEKSIFRHSLIFVFIFSHAFIFDFRNNQKQNIWIRETKSQKTIWQHDRIATYLSFVHIYLDSISVPRLVMEILLYNVCCQYLDFSSMVCLIW